MNLTDEFSNVMTTHARNHPTCILAAAPIACKVRVAAHRMQGSRRSPAPEHQHRLSYSAATSAAHACSPPRSSAESTVVPRSGCHECVTCGTANPLAPPSATAAACSTS